MSFRWHPQEEHRRSLHPILHPDIREIRQKIHSIHWLSSELTYDLDSQQWSRGIIDLPTQNMVEHILGFFSIADELVIENIMGNFANEIGNQCIDVRDVYIAITEQEAIHAESYRDQTIALFSTDEERERILNAVRTMPIITEMVEWVKTYMSSDITVGERLVGFIVVEGIWFTGSFCLLQWLKTRNLLPNITRANEFISRDEGVHVEFASLLFNKYLIDKPSMEEVHTIIKSGLEIAEKFTCHAIPESHSGMSSAKMIQYIRYQTDCILTQMGCKKLFNVVNPFDFMLNHCMKRKKNFFEVTPTEYQNIIDPDDLKYKPDTSEIELPDDDDCVYGRV